MNLLRATELGEKDPVRKLLATIGTPRVVEVAVPLAVTANAFDSAGTIMVSFVGKHQSFDLAVNSPLPPSSVLRIHSRGEIDFEGFARGYPATFRPSEG